MPKVSVDVRGSTKVPRFCKEYLSNHTQIAKKINFQLVNNQQVDVVEWDDNDHPTKFFEIKLNDDLVDSLNNNRLIKEMREYSELANKYDPQPQIYLLCGGYYEPVTYARLMSLVTEKWGWVKCHLSTSPRKIIGKMFKIIRSPDEEERRFIPTLVKSGQKGFVTSLQASFEGISEGLAEYIAPYIYYNMPLNKLEELFYDYYERYQNVKAKNFHTFLKNTYWRKTADG